LSLNDKIDVIDLIINVLKEHENSLDNLVERLEVLNKDLEQSMNESSFYARSKNNSSEALNRKIVELEKRIEKYRKIIKKILGHCEKINDIACVKKIADEVLEI
jgi:DNA-binding transcriptional MerR regulator